MNVWESDLLNDLNRDPSVWSRAEAMTLLDGAKDEARTDPACFDWLTQTFTPHGRSVVRAILFP